MTPNNRMNRIVSLSGHSRLCKRYQMNESDLREGVLRYGLIDKPKEKIMPHKVK